jgi:hypothetical protein
MMCGMKAADWVMLAWVLCAAIFWSAAGYAASEGLVGAAFAYSIVPVALGVCAGTIVDGLEKRHP